MNYLNIYRERRKKTAQGELVPSMPVIIYHAEISGLLNISEQNVLARFSWDESLETTSSRRTPEAGNPAAIGDYVQLKS